MDLPFGDEDVAVSKSFLDFRIGQFLKFTRSIYREGGVDRLRNVERSAVHITLLNGGKDFLELLQFFFRLVKQLSTQDREYIQTENSHALLVGTHGVHLERHMPPICCRHISIE